MCGSRPPANAAAVFARAGKNTHPAAANPHSRAGNRAMPSRCGHGSRLCGVVAASAYLSPVVRLSRINWWPNRNAPRCYRGGGTTNAALGRLANQHRITTADCPPPYVMRPGGGQSRFPAPVGVLICLGCWHRTHSPGTCGV